MIRIDAIRELRRDLHMRPFEADRRVYLVLDAHLLNEDAADALLKDLEEPPPYAVIVLVADDLGPMPETIRSRCQLVPFRRLSERAVREVVDARAPEPGRASARDRARARRRRAARPARAAARPERGRAARRADRAGARASTASRRSTPARGGGSAGRERARARGDEAREQEEVERRGPRAAGTRGRAAAEARAAGRGARGAAGPARGAGGLVPRPRRGRVGADRAAIHVDRLEELRADATRERLLGAERAAEAVRETWRRSRSSTSPRSSRSRRCSCAWPASFAVVRSSKRSCKDCPRPIVSGGVAGGDSGR